MLEDHAPQARLAGDEIKVAVGNRERVLDRRPRRVDEAHERGAQTLQGAGVDPQDDRVEVADGVVDRPRRIADLGRDAPHGDAAQAFAPGELLGRADDEFGELFPRMVGPPRHGPSPRPVCKPILSGIQNSS